MALTNAQRQRRFITRLTSRPRRAHPVASVSLRPVSVSLRPSLPVNANAGRLPRPRLRADDKSADDIREDYRGGNAGARPREGRWLCPRQ